MISRLFIGLLLSIPGMMGVLAPNSQTSGLFGYSAPYITASGGGSPFNSPVVFNSTTNFNATSTYADDVPIKFGTDGDFEIKFKTTGSPDLAVLTTPTSSNLFSIVSQEFKDYDYINNAGVSAPDPIMLFFPSSSTRNRIGQLSMSTDSFYIAADGGNDVDGTTRDADGSSIRIETSNAGSIGDSNGGNIEIALGNGVGTGVRGYIFATGGANDDIRFKNSGTGVFRVGESGAGEAALTLDHDGTNAIVSSTVGSIILGTTRVSVGASFSPTYSLDVFGDGRFTATGSQQLIYSNASGTTGLSGIRSYVAPSSATMSWNNFVGVIDQQVAKSNGDSSVFSGQISVNGADSGGTYRVFEAQGISASAATSVGLTVKSGYDAVFEVPVDATGNLTAATGRIPILVGGIIKYLRYYND